MKRRIKHVTVLGSGIMGSGIAAHLSLIQIKMCIRESRKLRTLSNPYNWAPTRIFRCRNFQTETFRKRLLVVL